MIDPATIARLRELYDKWQEGTCSNNALTILVLGNLPGLLEAAAHGMRDTERLDSGRIQLPVTDGMHHTWTRQDLRKAIDAARAGKEKHAAK